MHCSLLHSLSKGLHKSARLQCHTPLRTCRGRKLMDISLYDYERSDMIDRLGFSFFGHQEQCVEVSLNDIVIEYVGFHMGEYYSLISPQLRFSPQVRGQFYFNHPHLASEHNLQFVKDQLVRAGVGKTHIEPVAVLVYYATLYRNSVLLEFLETYATCLHFEHAFAFPHGAALVYLKTHGLRDKDEQCLQAVLQLSRFREYLLFLCIENDPAFVPQLFRFKYVNRYDVTSLHAQRIALWWTSEQLRNLLPFLVSTVAGDVCAYLQCISLVMNDDRQDVLQIDNAARWCLPDEALTGARFPYRYMAWKRFSGFEADHTGYDSDSDCDLD
jgi:hypothetical protein